MSGHLTDTRSADELAAAEQAAAQRTAAVMGEIFAELKESIGQESLESFLLDVASDDASDPSDSLLFVKSWFPEWALAKSRQGHTKESDDAGTRKKWYDKHAVFWATIDELARRIAARALYQNLYVSHLTSRERDLVTFLYAEVEQNKGDTEGIDKLPETIWDIQQNVGRVPTCHASIPCSMPGGRPWLRRERRALSGAESLLLQGCDPSFLRALRPGAWSSRFLQDLAGNAFNVPAFSTWFIAMFASG